MGENYVLQKGALSLQFIQQVSLKNDFDQGILIKELEEGKPSGRKIDYRPFSGRCGLAYIWRDFGVQATMASSDAEARSTEARQCR